jgi:hypothetical protein
VCGGEGELSIGGRPISQCAQSETGKESTPSPVAIGYFKFTRLLPVPPPERKLLACSMGRGYLPFRVGRMVRDDRAEKWMIGGRSDIFSYHVVRIVMWYSLE